MIGGIRVIFKLKMFLQVDQETNYISHVRPKKKIVVFQMTLRKKSGSVGREKLFFFFLKEQQIRGFQNYV